MTLKVQILQSLRKLFILLVGLTMTWFSEKNAYFHYMHLWFNAQLNKKNLGRSLNFRSVYQIRCKILLFKNAPHPSYLLDIFVVDLMMHLEFSKYLDKLQILPPFKKLTRAGQTLANALFSPLYNIDHPKVQLKKSCKGSLFMKQNLRFGLDKAGWAV